MAGHSKWANIKHRKASQDAKRGKLYTKLIKEVTVSSRLGGDDPTCNPRLRSAIDDALGANMPKDTIMRAVKRGAGDLDGGQMDEVRYEGYGPGGVAVMVDCLTDNRNRTVSEVRYAFSRCGGNLGTDGSVAYLFHKQGILRFTLDHDESALMDLGLDLGADDMSSDDQGYEVLCSSDVYHAVKEGFIAQGFAPDSAEITMSAEVSVTVDISGAEKMLRLLDILEDLDDVQKVYSNADIPDDILADLL